MKKFLLLVVVLGAVLAACSVLPQSTPTPLPTDTPLPPTATPFPTHTAQPTPMLSPTPAGAIYAHAYRLGRGVNLGNALEAPREGEWGVTLKEEYFQVIAEAGFDSVRVPIRFSEHADSQPPYTIDPELFARIDWVLENAQKNNLVAVVDMHHYLEVMEDPAGHHERFIALWQQIAERYQDMPTDEVYFELLNEPNGSLYGETWNQLVADTLAVVRQTNPDRPIVIDPGGWASAAQLALLALPEDDRNLIVTFHYYLPFQFTHQGAEWVDNSDPWLGKTWEGNTMDRRLMNTDFMQAADWGKQNNRPIYLGEFGAYQKADLDSRVRWTDAVARLAEQYGYPWAYWEFCAGFGVYDPAAEAWREPLLVALLPER
ncbi:MAG: glycoside hydrolase family 5 protein [Chloroflexota bacterium]